MVQGTASSAGKSLIATAFCRLFAAAGYRVAPFKSQNMSLNAAATIDGGEIGRAQAAQAEAAGVDPTVDMNPILLKPEDDCRSQVVVHGVVRTTVDFRHYQQLRAELTPLVLASLERLRRDYELVIIEGAGSPAEINLADTEIVNMWVARQSDARVVLVGDIERGGVFAALVGTIELLPPEDRARVGGFVINKFRGDPGILAPGLAMLTARTGIPVLGVVPMLEERLVPAEDSLDLEAIERRSPSRADESALIDIVVVRLPRIANFDDFEPLATEPGVRVRWASAAADLVGADLIVVPGSKTTIADLEWMRHAGIADAIKSAAEAGRAVLGVCGGYQMLGRLVRDPDHVESSVDAALGLDLLPVTTTFVRDKRTVRVRARVGEGAALFGGAAGAEIVAYEIHAGRTASSEGAQRDRWTSPFTITERSGAPVSDADGLVGQGGHVVGTYLHGLFGNGVVRRAALQHLASRRGIPWDPRWGEELDTRERYDRLATAIGSAIDMPAVAKLVGLAWPRRLDLSPHRPR
jgi:adenosylcobyric acid synthase